MRVNVKMEIRDYKQDIKTMENLPMLLLRDVSDFGVYFPELSVNCVPETVATSLSHETRRWKEKYANWMRPNTFSLLLLGSNALCLLTCHFPV